MSGPALYPKGPGLVSRKLLVPLKPAQSSSTAPKARLLNPYQQRDSRFRRKATSTLVAMGLIMAGGQRFPQVTLTPTSDVIAP